MELTAIRTDDVATEPVEQAVIVEFDYGLSDLGPMMALIKRLKTVLEETGDGDFDGWEVAMDLSEGTFYMYGPDAEELFYTVRPILMSVRGMRGARVTLRFGEGVREEIGLLPQTENHR